MASQEPKYIRNVMEITGLNFDDARLLLEICNGDADKAVGEYFEDSNILQKHRAKSTEDRRWREDHFSSDRDTNGNIIPSFQIQGPDVAPTRPNSRTANKSPNRDVIDLSNDAAAGALWTEYYERNGKANSTSAADPSTSWGYEQNNDEDMEKALRASLVDAGIGGPQESGIIGNVGEPQFGPANRSDYGTNEWAMVPLGTSSTHEIYLDPEPADRQRGEGFPALLKPSPDDSRVGALLTILHEVPLVRELLLARKHSIPDYGFDSEWWMGKKIEIPRLIVTADVEGEMDGFHRNHDLTEELQRLMAFLDGTNRSYGSVENVTRLLLEKPNGMDTMTAFFERWQEILPEDARGSCLSIAIQPVNEGDDICKPFAHLEVSDAGVSGSQNLYDCLDSMLWKESGLEWENSAFLRHLGEVLTFHLQGKTQVKSIDIPLVWYPDRYLESNRETALQMRKQKDLIKQKITKMNILKNKLTNFTKNGKTYKVRDLINASLTHDDRERPTTEAATPIVANTKVEDVDFEKQAALDRLSEQLRRTMASIDEKLASLEKEREKAQANLKELSEFFTQYAEGMHTYTLRGISTSPTVTYINRPTDTEDDSEASDANTNLPKGQWWRIDFVAGDRWPLTVHTVSEDVVTEAARESIEPILVYASEKAMNREHLIPLSHSLRQFLALDNEAFKTELAATDRGFEAPDSAQEMSMVATPQSPGKRKFNMDGEEEVDGFRKSPGRRGSMDVNFEDDDDDDDDDDDNDNDDDENWGAGDAKKDRFSDSYQEVKMPVQQEMAERSKLGLGMLGMSGGGTAVGDGDEEDLMDVDNVVMDESRVSESAAVREMERFTPINPYTR